MHPPSLKTAIRRIRSLAGPPDGITDSELLARFRATRDERAFAALVARHGPAVLGTCRRILGDPHTAEDAFQATFLVLARRAGAVRRPAALGCWLHGVAVRVSMKLKGRLARQPRSVETVEVPTDPRDDVLWRDVRRVLDEEVNRLPERLRLPVYLCYFEGKTRDEAADVLGWKVSTVRGRLEDGRLRLRTRLALRGIELSAALLAVSGATDGLAVGDALIEQTIRAATGSAPELVRSLARGVVASGVAAKAKLTAGAIVIVLGLGTTFFGFRGETGQAAGPGSGFKTPAPNEKAQPPAELIALMQAADRVWVVDSPTIENPIPEPIEELKGMSPPEKGYSFKFNVEAVKDLPRDGRRRVVFLKSIDEVDHIPKVAPVAAEKWFVPADDATLTALREYVPPCQWGEPSDGLRLGLYARPKADEPTVEVVVQNVGTKDLIIEQFRGNYFDDWPHLTFAVTGPAGKTYRLERQGGKHKDSDAPIDRILKAGDRYIHVVRLNRWLTAPDRGAAGNAPAGLFAGGGDFKVQATYQLADGRDPPRWWIGKLTAGPATVSIPAPGAYGDAAGDFRIRLRPVGKLKVGDSPELILDAKYAGKAKWTIDRRPENAEVEWDGKWYSPPVRRSFGGRALTEMAPGAEFLPWETIRPDGAWTHEQDKPGATGDPGEATKELVPLRLTPGAHAARVAYWFGKDARAVSNAITVEVAPDGWGEPAGGVSARLRIAKTKLKPGDPMEFAFDLKNVGRKTWNSDADPFACYVYIDDLTYTYAGPIDRKANLKEVKPGGELVPFLTGTVDANWMAPLAHVEVPPPQSVPFRLSPGKHKVQVAFPLDGRPPLTVSNTVEIEVEAAQLDAQTRAIALAADRIWIVPSPTREKPVPSPSGVLKGPPADATRGGLFDLRLLPADNPQAKWIVFVAGLEDGKSVPEMKVWPAGSWSRPYTPELADAIRRAFLPAEWGPEKDGLRLGLRLRQTEIKSGEPVAAEVTIRNVGTKPRELQQLRYNIYDYWPQVRFEVTAPDKTRWILEKPDGPMDEADAPTRITLKPGETYTHTLRLAHWPAAGPKDRKLPENVFTTPGVYTIACRYALTIPHNEAVWTAGLVSPAAKLTLNEPTKEPEWGEPSGGIRARVRLAKPKFKAGEPLAFELDLKNTGDQTVEDGPIPMFCLINLDGNEYRYTAPLAYPTSMQKLTPGKEFVPWVKVESNQWWTHLRGDQSVPLALTPGKHTLRVSYPLPGDRKPTSPAIEFEVVSDVIKQPDLAALATAADRIVVATFKWQRGGFGIQPMRTLKGAHNRWPPDVQPLTIPVLTDNPAELKPKPNELYILFLKAEEDGVEVPKLFPAMPRGWFRQATEKEIEAVAAAMPKPAESGEAVNGLALSLRPKTQTVRAGEEVRLEVVLANPKKDTLRVLQQRYNVYDYWPFLTFQITLPNGQKLTAAKPEGPFGREDFIDEVGLKTGESYAHVVRLDRWPRALFSEPGKYTIAANYKAPVGFKNLRPGVEVRDWPFWSGEVTSNAITVEVKSPFDEVRRGFDADKNPRLYLIMTASELPSGPLADLIVQYAGLALTEADRQPVGPRSIEFAIRKRPGDDEGSTTGFSREQLEAIRKAKPDEARRLAEEHAWSLGKLPDGK